MVQHSVSWHPIFPSNPSLKVIGEQSLLTFPIMCCLVLSSASMTILLFLRNTRQQESRGHLQGGCRVLGGTGAGGKSSHTRRVRGSGGQRRGWALARHVAIRGLFSCSSSSPLCSSLFLFHRQALQVSAGVTELPATVYMDKQTNKQKGTDIMN